MLNSHFKLTGLGQCRYIFNYTRVFIKTPQLVEMYSKQCSMIILFATVVGMVTSISISANPAAFGADVKNLDKRAPLNVK